MRMWEVDKKKFIVDNEVRESASVSPRLRVRQSAPAFYLHPIQCATGVYVTYLLLFNKKESGITLEQYSMDFLEL